jgi:Protein of unknown function (DUF2867)
VEVHKVPPTLDTVALLPRATSADTYSMVVKGPALDPLTAACRVFGRVPGWIAWLMKWRDRIAAPLGLKTARSNTLDEGNRIGAFPVISSGPEHVVLGFDDKHLDFRIVVEARKCDAGQSEVMMTTVVRTHNLLGRTYLVFVLPFHWIIVPVIIAQAAGD